MPVYRLTPQDVLMFRDGRPMEGGLSGHGARWPEPGIIFDAIHAALHRAFPEISRLPDNTPVWEHEHRYGRGSNRDYSRPRSQRFGALTTTGPFPIEDNAWFFPCPADVTAAEESVFGLLQPIAATAGSSNLPSPLLFPLANSAAPSKDEPAPWWSKLAIERYLTTLSSGSLSADANGFWQSQWRKTADLFASEWATGIGIDAATLTTGRGQAQGQIYSAEYLRFRSNVSLGVHATLPMPDDRSAEQGEALQRLFPAQKLIVVGGQQRICRVEEVLSDSQPVPLDHLLPLSEPISGDRMKWMLLSPAIFPAIESAEIEGADGQMRQMSAHPGGWLPTWIAPHVDFCVWQGDRQVAVQKGQVLLKQSMQRIGGSRQARRESIRQAGFLDCRLVAARIPKPIVLTGWSERLHLIQQERCATGEELRHGPRPTLLAVPAGAVYYFQGKDAPRLAEALAWHGSARSNIYRVANRRSTLLGEKGYGLGVCGPWNSFQDVSGRPAR